jgi:2-polyprenyl-3-methyl-5-hydroxy-6-metoxy-1,4-benzoquinol methylase
MQLIIQCPECNHVIEWDALSGRCVNDHFFTTESGVYQVLGLKQKEFLAEYLPKFSVYRQSAYSKINAENINNLPFVDFDKGLWKLRKYDLELISEFLPNQSAKILDIGAWNGWLSHQLAKKANQVTAIDYFIEPFDGLQSINYYQHKFIAIQMSPLEVGLIKTKFDIIVLNRCLAYIPKIEMYLEQLKSMLNPKGKIIITGIVMTKNTDRIINNLNKTAIEFEKKYGISFFIHPIKGYLDEQDLEIVRKSKFDIKIYPELYWKTQLTKIGIGNNGYYYGIFQSI